MRFTPLCLLLLLSSCSVFGDDEKADLQSLPAAVEYRVNGTDASAFVTYQDSTGTRIAESVGLPWSYAFQADSIRALYVHAQATDATIRIRINGEVYREATASKGEAAALAWAPGTPRVGYLVSGQNAGTFSVVTMEGELTVNTSSIASAAQTYSFRESYDVEPGFIAYINSDIAPGLNCPSFSVVYVDDNNTFYVLDSAQTCEQGTVVSAVIPGF